MIISKILILLQSLVSAFGPSGQENEVKEFCQSKIKPLVDEMWIDPAGNLIGKIYGEDQTPENSMKLLMHMDEISLIVKKINSDGSIIVSPLGGIYPFSSGQGPVEILGDFENVKGILSFGSVHLKKGSFNDSFKENQWKDAKVITRKSIKDLEKAGIHPGIRIVQAKSRRQLEIIEDCIAGYFLDNRAGVATAILALEKLNEKKIKPKNNVYFIFTCFEECGGQSSSYAARTIPGEISIAIDTCPASEEMQTVLDENPIILYKDQVAIYDKKTCDQLALLAKKINLNPQYLVSEVGGTDASLAQIRGQTAKSAFIGIPTENLHGYEIIKEKAIDTCSDLILEYLIN